MARILGIARPGIDREREISEADRKGIMRKICVLVFTIFFMSLEREVYKWGTNHIVFLHEKT